MSGDIEIMTAEIHRIPIVANESICLDWSPREPSAPIAIFVHGLGSHRRGEKARYFAHCFNQQGWTFAAADLRGHGESDGSMRDLRMSSMLADIRALRGWIAARSAVTAPVLFIGVSMGAALIAWHTLEQHESMPLIMIAPSLDFPRRLALEIEPSALQDWRRLGSKRHKNQWMDIELGAALIDEGQQYNAAELLRLHRAPTLIIHGMNDEIVPWRESASFAAQCHAPVLDLLLLKDGDHRLTYRKEYLFQAIGAWVRTQQAEHGVGFPAHR